MKTLRIQREVEAAELLRQGKLVAFPTETVFGLGGSANSESCIKAIFAAKGRPSDNPLIVHVASVEQVTQAAREVTPTAARLLNAFAPGPLTVVLPKRDTIAPSVTAGLDTVGVRIPSCQIAQAVIQASGLPIAAPSANRSGRPSPTLWQTVLEDLDGRVDGILCKNSSVIGLESSVVDCTGDVPVLLRPGAVTLADLQTIEPGAQISQDVNAQTQVNSPGVRHPHYQPNARVRLLDAPQISSPDRRFERAEQVVFIGISPALVAASEERMLWCKLFENVEAFAAGFYEALREADRRGAKEILVERATPVGLGIALLDRQQRAAGDK